MNKSLLNTRLLIPVIIMFMGVFNLMNKTTSPDMRTLWMFLTPFAFLILVLRIWMLSKKDNSENDGQNQ